MTRQLLDWEEIPNPGSYNDMAEKHPGATHDELMLLHSAVLTIYRGKIAEREQAARAEADRQIPPR